MPPHFHTTLLGYDRLEVDDHLRQSELAHARLADERDTATARCRELERRLGVAHEHNAELQTRIELLKREPIDAAALQERLRGMLDVAREEAAEHLAEARARAAADLDAARSEAAEHLAEVRAQAAAELNCARREVAELQRLRDRLRDQLRQAGQLLEGADLHTEPVEPPRLAVA